MAIKLRVSPLVREWIDRGLVAARDPQESYDVTVIAVEEDGLWVDRAHRRLRPHFVSDPEQALLVYEEYAKYAESEKDGTDRDRPGQKEFRGNA